MGKQEKSKLELLNEILENQKGFDSYHPFFIKSHLPMWVYDKDTYLVLDANKAACEIYGYSREEFLKMSILDFRPKKDKERLLKDLKKHRLERSFSKGWQHQFKNGQVIDVEVSSQEINYEGKEAVIAIVNDITSEIEYKNKAKESEEKFRLITTHAIDAIILMDEKGCVTLWNPAAEKIFGFTNIEVIGKDLHSFIMPQRYGEQMKKGFSHFIKSGQGPLIGNVIEMEALHKSGHEFPISILVTSFKLNNEWNAAAIIRDITEQKRADELALANKELAFQKKLDVYRSEMESVANDLTRLIDTANAPIFGIDSKGLVNEWNQASEKITGFKKDEVLGKLLLNPHYQKIAVLK